MRVIALAGGTASGKSTLCDALAEHLGDRANVLVHDRYYRTVSKDMLATWNFDHPRALETDLMVTHIRELLTGKAVDVPRYDFASHERTPATDRLEPREILVVEGILVLSNEDVRALSDTTIFVDTPSDIRLARRLSRDVAQRGRDALDVVRQYLETVRPMHEAFVEPSKQHAQVKLDGTLPIPEMTARALEALSL